VRLWVRHTDQSKEAAEQMAAPALQQTRPAADEHVEDVTVTVLALAPGLKEGEQRGEGAIGPALEVTIDQDVALVADLLGKVDAVGHPAQRELR